MDPRDALARAGRALHGEMGWQAPIARDVGVNENTVGRWMSGRVPLPADHGVFTDVLALLRRRSQEIAEATADLEKWIRDHE